MPNAAHCRIAKTPQRSPAPTAPAQGDPARLPHRALQAVRQAGMQMRRRSRPWPQVLSFGELPGLAAANGLCAAGVLRPDGRVPRQLPPSPRDLRGDLRDQPRTAAPPGGALKGRHERSAFSPSDASIDVELGGVLLANMLEAWLARQPKLFRQLRRQPMNPKITRTSPEPTRLHLLTPVDAWPGAPPSGEHGAPVCTAREGAGTGLERIR